MGNSKSSVEMLFATTSAFTRYPFCSSGKQPANPQQTDLPFQPKADLQQRALQWLHEQPPDSHLDDIATIESSFPSGPSLSKDKIHIIVATSEGMSYTLLYPILLIQ